MRKVIGIGETVLDIIFREGQPIGAVPGGSVFNSLISLGRAGVAATMLSETGNDRVGKEIVSFARKNGVDADSISMVDGAKSPVSLAFLGEQNDAEYIFYKDHPHDRADFTCPDIVADDIVMFGSFYAVNPVIRRQVHGFLTHAKQQGAILYYDVNFRAAHRHELAQVMPNLLENLALADIVRASHEDLQVIFGTDDADSVYAREVSPRCPRFVCTRGAGITALLTPRQRRDYPTPPVATVSTIGAGDNFNAGVVYALLRHNITRAELLRGLTEEQWDDIVRCGQAFAADCCQHIGNYITPELGEKLKS